MSSRAWWGHGTGARDVSAPRCERPPPKERAPSLPDDVRTAPTQLTPAGTSLAWLLPRNRHEISNMPTPRKAGQVIRRCTLTTRHGNSGEAVACRALNGRSTTDFGHRSSVPRPDPDAGSQDTPRGDVGSPT